MPQTSERRAELLWEENDRLRKENERLRSALRKISAFIGGEDAWRWMRKIARNALNQPDENE